jgi:hypothetical protein
VHQVDFIYKIVRSKFGAAWFRIGGVHRTNVPQIMFFFNFCELLAKEKNYPISPALASSILISCFIDFPSFRHTKE